MEKFASVENRLRLILLKYNNARERGDFLETIFSVHTAIEDSLNLKLGDDIFNELSFNEKFSGVFPKEFEKYSVIEITKTRNHLAHPKRKFSDEEIYNVAKSIVSLALDLWPKLFTSSPPIVTHPQLLGTVDDPSVEKILRKKDEEIGGLQRKLKDLQGRISTKNDQESSFTYTKKSHPWRLLILLIVLLLTLSFLWGFSNRLREFQAFAWYVILIPYLVIIIIGALTIRSLYKFVRVVTIRRLIVILSMGIFIAAIAFTPFTTGKMVWSERVGDSLVQVLEQFFEIPSNIISEAFSLGESTFEFLSSYFPGNISTDEGQNIKQIPSTKAKPELIEDTNNPIFDDIKVGASVIVETDGMRLMCRKSPGISTEIIGRYENGTRLTIIDGPEEINDFIWWKVQNNEEKCWCVEEFLTLAIE